MTGMGEWRRSQWQPIETAPKDGRTIMAANYGDTAYEPYYWEKNARAAEGGSMTDDIVVRLRRMANGDDIYYDVRCLRDAADEIERLRAQVAKLREALGRTAANTCCAQCREAALVARAALKETER